MNKLPLISILMPAYNAEKFIGLAVDSVLKQTYKNWELLIIDDGSTDNTSNVVENFSDSRINLSEHQQNKGYLLSCNELFKLAKGDLITFLDADDSYPKNRLFSCLQIFLKNAAIDFLTTDHVKTDINGKTISEHPQNIDYSRYSREAEYYPTICCATIMLRKDLLRKVGGYHPFFQDLGGEDYHWLFRLSRAEKGFHLQEKLYNYRTHKEQLHLQYKYPLKFFVQEIDIEIRRELILSGDDLLQESEKLKSDWGRHIETHPEELLYRKASWALNNNKKKASLSFAFSAFLTSPFSFTSWKRFLYLIYSNARR